MSTRPVEVRSLAGRSAEAAKEIQRLINASVERVEQSTPLVDRAGVTMAVLVEKMAAASSLKAQGLVQSVEVCKLIPGWVGGMWR